MTPTEGMLLVQWAREQERGYGGLTSAQIVAPSGLDLGTAFKLLADCAAAGIASAKAGTLTLDMLDDPR